ncbi:hypothetical protein B0H19DRAFT_1080023 [Mycena capillaripes]|nr:hypothetical protein B0H19DRAFT_1080023 [Mycena capillaripes]
MPAPRTFLLLLLPTLFTITHAALANVTIDDSDLSHFTWTEDTDVFPQPTIPWAGISPTSPCGYCSAQPQTAEIHDQTWHDGSNNSAGSFTFQGQAVYIYGISQINSVNISFTMDGTASGFHYYTGSAQFVFNSLFFAATDLTANFNHSVSWVLHATTTSGVTGAGLFDYAVITVDQSQSSSPSPSSSTSPSATAPPSKPKSKSKTGAIVGGVVGGLAFIAALGLIVLVLMRRRRTTASNTPGAGPASRVRSNDVQPFMEQTATSPTSATTPGSVGEKTLDVSWLSPLPSAPTAATESTANLSSMPTSVPTDAASTHALSSSDLNSAPATDSETRTTSTRITGSRSARERELEQRLAELEAQVQQHLTQPPPYVPPPSPSGM